MSSGPKWSVTMLSGPFLRGQKLWADSFCGRWISNGPILWAPLFLWANFEWASAGSDPPVRLRRARPPCNAA